MRTIPITRRNLRNLALMTVTTLWPPNTLVLARNAIALRRREPWEGYVESSGATLETLADEALSWICRSQDRVGSGGVGDYQFQGWTAGYPEVTGYIIPTFWDYHRLLRRDELAQRAIRMADWELRVQKPEGGFESWYEGEGQPPVVFNTGQVIRGLTRTYEETGEERYLQAAVRAADWVVANQDPDGSWTKAGYMGMKRTYDVYAAAALAMLSTVTAEDAYARAATANCEFALENQHGNGWFDLCDNTPQGNATPSTHTLCYTIDGLIETGEALGEDGFIAGGERAARALLEMVDSGGRLPGRFDRDWRPASGYVVLTGSAQLGLILTKLYRRRPRAPSARDRARPDRLHRLRAAPERRRSESTRRHHGLLPDLGTLCAAQASVLGNQVLPGSSPRRAYGPGEHVAWQRAFPGRRSG